MKDIVVDYVFVMNQLSQIREERELMLSTAHFWRKEPSKSLLDEKYGEGAAAFFADALEAFYQK